MNIRYPVLVLAIALAAVVVGADPPAGANSASRPVEAALLSAELDRLLDRLEKELGPVKTMRVTFEQEKHLSLLADVVHAHGACYFVRPDTVRFEINEPFRSVLIAKGRSVAKYEFAGGRWEKLKLDSPDVILMVTGQIASWLKGNFRAQTDIYDISAMVRGHTVIMLTPRSAEMRKHIRAIELELDAKGTAVATVTIRESGGDFTQLIFSREERDIELPLAIFETAGDAPPDVAPAFVPQTVPHDREK